MTAKEEKEHISKVTTGTADRKESKEGRVGKE